MKTMYKLTLLTLVGVSVVGCSGDGVASMSSSKVGLWCTTSVQTRGSFEQMDRLARPVVNEVFGTVANDRHQVNNRIGPAQDKAELANDIQKFFDDVFSFAPNGRRSKATVDVVKSVLVPDMLVADLSITNAADGAYLGTETGGATGNKFGGRALTDDVVDISLGVVFGKTVSALGLAPEDGKDIPTLTSDNVGSGLKNFSNTFPYLGPAR